MNILRSFVSQAMSVSPSTYLKVIGVVSAVVFTGEFIGRKKNFVYRPSFFIAKTANGLTTFFTKLGEGYAWIGSYLTQIDMKEITNTAIAIGEPSWNLVKSPVYTIIGYAESAATYGNKEWMIYIGSALLTALIGYGCYYMSARYPWLNIWSPMLNIVKRRIAN